MRRELPKYIIKTPSGSYRINIPIKGTNKNKYINGGYNLSEAISIRDNYLSANQNIHNSTYQNEFKGVLKRKERFLAYLEFKHGTYNGLKQYNIHIGSYNTQEEAIQARLEFIESLK